MVRSVGMHGSSSVRLLSLLEVDGSTPSVHADFCSKPHQKKKNKTNEETAWSTKNVVPGNHSKSHLATSCSFNKKEGQRSTLIAPLILCVNTWLLEKEKLFTVQADNTIAAKMITKLIPIQFMQMKAFTYILQFVRNNFCKYEKVGLLRNIPFLLSSLLSSLISSRVAPLASLSLNNNDNDHSYNQQL